jgi:hypothetical protein
MAAAFTADDRHVLRKVVSIGPRVGLAVPVDPLLYRAAFRKLTGCPRASGRAMGVPCKSTGTLNPSVAMAARIP